jgi:hypothetical protein
LITSVKNINKCSLRHRRPLLQKNLGRGSPFNVSYQNWSSPQKPLGQLQSNFCGMIQNCVRWSRLPTKMVTKLKLWGPSWSKGRTAGHIFGREPSNDYFIKILFLLSKWFQTRRFLCEFPIGSYVKLSDFLWTLNFCQFWPIMQIRKKGGWN